MILTIPLKNDNFRECAEYYKLDYERHMSNHVEKEVFSVIERLRLISLDIFKHIKDYIISNNIPLIKIPKISKFSQIKFKHKILIYKIFILKT